MKITCISASNTKLIGDKSTSTMVCSMIKNIIEDDHRPDISVNIVPLMNYDLTPCILCGSCCDTSNCIYDKSFNEIYSQLSDSDGIFLVVPHYSPIPSKLLMIFEKLNEIIYSRWLKDNTFESPFAGKPVGIIGHGGCPESEQVLRHYHDNLIAPVAKTLQSLSFSVVGFNEEFPYGISFGLKDENCLRTTTDSIFPEVIQDWGIIESRITPLVANLIKKIDNP